MQDFLYLYNSSNISYAIGTIKIGQDWITDIWPVLGHWKDYFVLTDGKTAYGTHYKNIKELVYGKPLFFKVNSKLPNFWGNGLALNSGGLMTWDDILSLGVEIQTGGILEFNKSVKFEGWDLSNWTITNSENIWLEFKNCRLGNLSLDSQWQLQVYESQLGAKHPYWDLRGICDNLHIRNSELVYNSDWFKDSCNYLNEPLWSGSIIGWQGPEPRGNVSDCLWLGQ